MKLYPWQYNLYQQLTDAFLQNHRHHALLFKTELGLGTDKLIRHFAHWLLCHQPHNDQPCYQCKSCLLVESENHPDFHLLQSIDNKEIGIDQIRGLNSQLQQFAQQDGNIVVYISDIDKLNESSANALLKSLEEPNNDIYFLLKSPLQSTIIATIQSRCQQWIIHSPQQQTSVEWLQQQYPKITSEEIETALKLCHYRPLFCKKFIESDRLSQRKSFLQTFWRFYKSNNILLLLRAFDKEKEDILEQLDWLASFFSDALKAQMNINTHWINPDLQKGIVIFSQQLTAQKLLKGHNIIQQTQQDLIHINTVNQELMLIDCLTKLVLDVFE
ncbi:DNA polymerase III subunit delta' [Phocoenobacter skyensis]|uniref:DNA polymerase III subunit delta' n=1 Tax=Phocoenobacter skyensis TaxID=97481 RepID=A0A1H7WAW7_9PAST|nr:DNA polymerase III subunit delta' [Pasteurella skyensis]MDP8079173.1 DNA polymerase III subunit delta' [Pasteurella skyensis]MDP8085123.1 DNA polymerase III subunit delta' [Pasteurella skyensis]MDP8184981.1 DNA polymerase III subunit delta' [Pasteurella skyensis]QLB23036.1 DNA polymerase III subunit delta' [Pasteurella skyensis]SEM18235.1 DNA polymerase-3 subunit delta' [Pasteurella skyensis]